MLLRYCLSDIQMVSVAPIITGITFVYIFHMRWICILRSFYSYYSIVIIVIIIIIIIILVITFMKDIYNYTRTYT